MAVDVGAASNQPPPLEGYDLFTENRPLVEALRREGGGAWEERAAALGVELGGEPLEWGRLANTHPPVLRSHDRYGERLDEIEFHPAWHSLMTLGVRHGLHALPWREPLPGAHVARAAMFVTYSQVEQGSGCPLSMTYAAVPALRAEPGVAAEWEPRLASLAYEPRLLPAAEKESALCGMAMTEKQGGSDVRANESVAQPLGRRRRVPAHRAQVVLLGADVRRLPRARPGARRPLVLPAPARAARRHAQRLPPPAAEGQARQPLERLRARSSSTAPGRGSSARRARRPDDHRDGQPHAARLRHRLGRADAPRRRPGDPSRRAPVRVRPAARRAAADAERAGRPLRRVGGRDRDGAAHRARLRRGRRRLSPARDRGREVLGLQARRPPRGRGARVPRRQRLRRGVESCRASTARRRSTRSGKAPGNIQCLDVLRALRSSRRASTPSSPRSRSPRAPTSASTPRSRSYGASSPTRTASSSARAASSSGSRLAFRARCLSATPRPRSPTPTARRASQARRARLRHASARRRLRRDRRASQAARLSAARLAVPRP